MSFTKAPECRHKCAGYVRDFCCGEFCERLATQTAGLTPEEREFAYILVGNGWAVKEAAGEARQQLADAAIEDGYDGP